LLPCCGDGASSGVFSGVSGGGGDVSVLGDAGVVDDGVVDEPVDVVDVVVDVLPPPAPREISTTP